MHGTVARMLSPSTGESVREPKADTLDDFSIDFSIEYTDQDAGVG